MGLIDEIKEKVSSTVSKENKDRPEPPKDENGRPMGPPPGGHRGNIERPENMGNGERPEPPTDADGNRMAPPEEKAETETEEV